MLSRYCMLLCNRLYGFHALQISLSFQVGHLKGLIQIPGRWYRQGTVRAREVTSGRRFGLHCDSKNCNCICFTTRNICGQSLVYVCSPLDLAPWMRVGNILPKTEAKRQSIKRWHQASRHEHTWRLHTGDHWLFPLQICHWTWVSSCKIIQYVLWF